MVNTKQFWLIVKKQYFEYCKKHDSLKTITICQTSELFEEAWDSYTLHLEISELASKFLVETEKKEYWFIGHTFLFHTTTRLKNEHNLNSTEIRKEFLEWIVKQQF